MRTALVLAAFAALAGCTTAPAVTKQQMTLAQANISGMECRRETPIGSNKERTVCASPEAWDKFDAEQKREADYDMEAVRSGHYINAFRRP